MTLRHGDTGHRVGTDWRSLAVIAASAIFALAISVSAFGAFTPPLVTGGCLAVSVILGASMPARRRFGIRRWLIRSRRVAVLAFVAILISDVAYCFLEIDGFGRIHG